MIMGHESISQYSRSNVMIWMAMAFQAGLLNIGGYLACHRFVSHVTGFATYFGSEFSQAHFNQAFGLLSAPLFFLLGSMLSGQLVDIRLKLHKKPKYYITFGVIFVLTLLVLIGGLSGYFGPFGHSTHEAHNYHLLALLCLTCGIQNGTITTVSKSVVRTTHLTGITTDLGIGLVRFLNQDKLEPTSNDENRANLMRIGIIGFFLVGSVGGGWIFHRFEYAGFGVPVVTSGTLFALMFYYQVYKSNQSEPSSISTTKA